MGLTHIRVGGGPARVRNHTASLRSSLGPKRGPLLPCLASSWSLKLLPPIVSSPQLTGRMDGRRDGWINGWMWVGGAGIREQMGFEAPPRGALGEGEEARRNWSCYKVAS